MRSRAPRERPPLPQHPYRDSLVLNVVLATVIVVLSWLTGGDVARSLLIAAGFVVLATAWSWWRFRGRIEQAARREAEQDARP
jgi:membrane protein implicated in regulation of membrane protease activity